jgi:mannose-6-phosphate isomerase-like protein (cupin superfamily)
MARAAARASRRAVIPPPRRAARAPDVIAPDGSEIRILATEREGATRASLCDVRLAAGAVSRPVQHASVEETWYVLAGRGHVWRCPPGDAGADAVAVAPGDALVIPVGWRFQFRAAPDAALRFLCFTSPPWPGDHEATPGDPGGLGPPTL